MTMKNVFAFLLSSPVVTGEVARAFSRATDGATRVKSPLHRCAVPLPRERGRKEMAHV